MDMEQVIFVDLDSGTVKLPQTRPEEPQHLKKLRLDLEKLLEEFKSFFLSFFFF